MSGFDLGQITDRFWAFWNTFLKRADDEETTGYPKEKIFVFFVALVLALCLWFLVNLSRAYTISINLPIILGNIPAGMALSDELPEFVTVSIQGEGWTLLSLYNNPPGIQVNIEDGEVNLLDQVQQQMNATPDVDVQNVQPLVLNLQLEEQLSRTVPLQSNVKVIFTGQFDFIGRPGLSPDSVTITGAASIVEDITFWDTDSVVIDNVRGDLAAPIPLKQPPDRLSLSMNTVQFIGSVTQFTEGESRVFVRARNLPDGQNITFSPAFVTVRYTIPIDQYANVENLSPFTAYVPFAEIEQDSSGFLAPQIEATTGEYEIRVQSHQPQEVAYFLVLE